MNSTHPLQPVDQHPWTIASETSVLRDVLLCSPEHYEWIPTNDISRRSLALGKPFDLQGAQAQFRELEDALDRAGVARHYLAAEAGLPYQVYTRDSSQLTPWGVVVTQLERPQRRGEIGSIVEFYRANGVPIWQFASAGSVEGGDIHVIRPGLLAIGVSEGRTTTAGAKQLAGWFEAEGWETTLVPMAEHFLHLDVIFSMVSDGLALACTDVLDDGFLAWLAQHRIRTLPVSYKEAMHAMACNVLSLGRDRVISPQHNRRINELLAAEGIDVLAPRLDLFATGGGSVHCMTMPLRRD
ncbi:MAG: arginine deiminase family protein [Devosia sp.]|nr:arginine deiminase family protein [Devosia sp.]